MGTKKNSRKNVAATRAASMNTGSEPQVSKTKVMHAKAEKPAAVATTGKKIGKGSGAAKKAAGKAKVAKAPRKSGGGGSRQSFAGKAIKVLTKAADTGFREGSGREARFAVVAAAKNTDDVLGKSFKAKNGKSGEITGAHIAFFVENGNIALS